jgi:peroxiredoxin Q/BCP
MFNKVIVLAAIIGLAIIIPACSKKKQQSAANAKLKVGDKAPDFALKDETGTIRTLAEFKDKNVALYFYPKDQTPGCTAQACSLRDGFSDLKNAGIVVLGISYDSPESHRKFKEKHHLNFTLLSDTDKEASRKYNVSGLLMPDRVTFLIDADGIVIKILKDVNVKDHAHEIIKAFNK